jgi:hypothetical protein
MGLDWVTMMYRRTGRPKALDRSIRDPMVRSQRAFPALANTRTRCQVVTRRSKCSGSVRSFSMRQIIYFRSIQVECR